MSRFISIALLLCMTLYAEDFISEFEYGQMLYQNPRGVSCVPCHAETGEGTVIASYRDKNGNKKELRGPDIRFDDLDAYRKSFKKGPGVMPRYLLTDKEIRAIYRFIRQVNSEKDEDGIYGHDAK